MSDDDSAAMLDRVARRYMNMSGEEFIARWTAGEWADTDLDSVPGLVDVWAYVPAVR
ncbi:hypothetical protein [Alloactinosynnema sp. L-07]|uniref:hypothetical protein n=1 Tax=Alloactinosynnema sp. L-07 TaxID=1653480 RepID=UPI001E3FAD96|nr:hypothetical protein [Alloactinosynnema sp. L-07]